MGLERVAIEPRTLRKKRFQLQARAWLRQAGVENSIRRELENRPCQLNKQRIGERNKPSAEL